MTLLNHQIVSGRHQILVSKPDGSYRMCTDYRKVNSCTKADTSPLPRLDDCIDKIGH